MLKTHKFNKVFFCSAYNDIPHILALIERNKHNNFLVFVTYNRGIFDFFNELKLQNTQIIFLTSKLFGLKKTINWVKEFINVLSIKKTFLNKIHKTDIVFFASFYDLLTCSFVNYLKNDNKLFLSIPIEDDFVFQKNLSIKIALLSFIYQVRLNQFSRFNNTVVGLPLSFIKKYVNTEDFLVKERELIAARKNYTISVSSNSPFYLILDAADSYEDYISNYSSNMDSIYNLLESLNSFIKGHPRIGLSPQASKYNFKRIKEYIPIEFIDFSNCNAVIGIESIALANIANMGVTSISLLKLLDYKDDKIREGWIQYLNRYSDKVLFPESFEELKNLIISAKEKFEI